MKHGEPEMLEEQAWPAMPDNEYGLEKLYAERMALAYGRKFGTKVRIARFQNTFGSFGTWTGGKEKAPAAICRKIAEAKLTGKNAIEVWGDGTAVRSYTYIEDLLDGIRLLMKSDIENSPQIANIGCPQYVSVNELVETVSRVAGYPVNIKHIKGPVGVESRNFSNSKIESLGWKSQYNLENGIKLTYPWIEQQVKLAMENEKAKQAADPWKETEETKTNEEDIKHQLNTTEQKQAEQAKQT